MLGRGQELGIAVVHHRTAADLLSDALSRVLQAAPLAHVVVVDSSGPQATEPDLPATVEILEVSNHSYSHAVNRGLDRLERPFLVQMNADVLVEGDTFERLLHAARSDPKAGVVGPLALNPAGKPQDLGLPYRFAYAAATRAGAAGASVPWLSGCLQLIDRRLWQQLGGYDESLRFTNEDLEFCIRARKDGWTCRLVPAPVVHIGGASTPAHPAFHVEGRRGGYVLSERYRSATEAFLHRGFLRAEALLGSLLARDELSSASHLAMQRLLDDGDWQRSPFGDTLDDR